jgi:hypothetical protein
MDGQAASPSPESSVVACLGRLADDGEALVSAVARFKEGARTEEEFDKDANRLLRSVAAHHSLFLDAAFATVGWQKMDEPSFGLSAA